MSDLHASVQQSDSSASVSNEGAVPTKDGWKPKGSNGTGVLVGLQRGVVVEVTAGGKGRGGSKSNSRRK